MKKVVLLAGALAAGMAVAPMAANAAAPAPGVQADFVADQYTDVNDAYLSINDLLSQDRVLVAELRKQINDGTYTFQTTEGKTGALAVLQALDHKFEQAQGKLDTAKGTAGTVAEFLAAINGQYIKHPSELVDLESLIGGLDAEWAAYNDWKTKIEAVDEISDLFTNVALYDEVDEMNDVKALKGEMNTKVSNFKSLIDACHAVRLGQNADPLAVGADCVAKAADITAAFEAISKDDKSGVTDKLVTLVNEYKDFKTATLTKQQERYLKYDAWYKNSHNYESIETEDGHQSDVIKNSLKDKYDAVKKAAYEAANFIFSFGADKSVFDVETMLFTWGTPDKDKTPFDTYAGAHAGENNAGTYDLAAYEAQAQKLVDKLNIAIETYQVTFHNAELNRDAYNTANADLAALTLDTAADKNYNGTTYYDLCDAKGEAIKDAEGHAMPHPKAGQAYYAATAYDTEVHAALSAAQTAQTTVKGSLADAFENFKLVEDGTIKANHYEALDVKPAASADCDKVVADAVAKVKAEGSDYDKYQKAQKTYNDLVKNANANEAAYDELYALYVTAVADGIEVAAGDKGYYGGHYDSETADKDVEAKRTAVVKALTDAKTALDEKFEAEDGKNLADATVAAAVEQALNDASKAINMDYSQAVKKANMNDDAYAQGKLDIENAKVDILKTLSEDPRYKDIATFEDPEDEVCPELVQKFKDLRTELDKQYQAETAVEYVDGDLHDALTTEIPALYQAHLDNILTWYHKIVPAVNEVYHDFEVLQYETYANAVEGIKCAADDEYGTWIADTNVALKEVNDHVKVAFKEHLLNEAKYNELKAEADAVTARVKEISDYIAARIAQNEENYNTLLEAYNTALTDFNNIVEGDVEHAETECPSATAKADVIAKKAAAQAALDAAKTALEDAHDKGNLCEEPDYAIDHNKYLDVDALINDAYKAVNIDYSGAVRDAEANDAAYEDFAQLVEDVMKQYTAAYNAIKDAELPVGTDHDECYEELRDEALAALNGLYLTYVEPSQIWAEDSYQAETLVADYAEIEDQLKAMLSLLDQPKNAMDDKVKELQANDAAYTEFMVAAQNFFNQIFTPTLNLVTDYEIPYEGHDECYEAVRTEATNALEDTYNACNALVQTAEYCWHHDAADFNAELESRGMTQHSMVANLDELLRILNEVLTKEISDTYNAFQKATGDLEANDEAYYNFMNEIVGAGGLEEQWTQVRNNVVANEEFEALYNADEEGRVELYEDIKDYYNVEFNKVAGDIEALKAAAEEAWHKGTAPTAIHSFLAREEALYGDKEDIQKKLTDLLNEFNAEMEEWHDYLENERIYRYEYQDVVDELHAVMQNNQAILDEIAATTEYKGFPYAGAPALAEAYKAIALVGACVETDKVATDKLFAEDAINFVKGTWTPATEFAYTTHCTHSEGGWVAEFNKHKDEIATLVGPVIADIELFKANVDAYEEMFVALEDLSAQWTMVGNATVNVEEYSEDPFVQDVLDEYRALYFGISRSVSRIQGQVDELFEARTLVDELENLYHAIEDVQIALTGFMNEFNDAVEDAHHLTNGKKIYSDQEYFTIGFFREANNGYDVQTSEEMFTSVIANFDGEAGNIGLYDMTWLETEDVDPSRIPEGEFGILAPVYDEKGHLVHQDGLGFIPYAVQTLVVGSKSNELSFELRDKNNGRQEVATLAAGPADITFQEGALTVDGWTTKHPVYVELFVEAPEVEIADAEVATGSNKLVVRLNNPIDLTYTINSLVAKTDTGVEFSYADRQINYAAGQLEFILPEGTQSVELPEGFFTFRTGENSITRSAAMVVTVNQGTTSIDELVAMGEKAQIFDLQGRRVKAEALISGNTYVVNGEKTMVK